MIKLILISSLAVLVSCASSKERKAQKEMEKAPVVEAIGNENEAAPPIEQRPMREEDMMNRVGTVRLDRPGCPVQIEMINGDLFSTLYPVNLDQQYHKEGLKIKFTYMISRAPSPEGCVADMVVSLSDVEIIK